MILRRFTQHIKEQNWFAVGLDVIVVIVGIFLGMQVTEWNEHRNERLEERRLLTDLSNDLKGEVKRLDDLFNSMTNYNQLVDEIVDKIFSADESVKLTPEECAEISRAHIAPHLVVRRLSTLEEILATGKLPLISDRNLKKSILNLYGQLELDTAHINFIVSDLMNLVDHHADVFPRAPSNDGNFSSDCDINTIRGDQTVLNKILGNRGRYGGIHGRFNRMRMVFLDLLGQINDSLNLAKELP